MVFEFSMGVWALLIVAVGAIVLGIVVQLIGESRTGYEWIITAIGGAIGAIVASEFIVSWQAYEPVFDGLALIPALIGGLVVGVVVGVATRLVTGGTYAGTPAA